MRRLCAGVSDKLDVCQIKGDRACARDDHQRRILHSDRVFGRYGGKQRAQSGATVLALVDSLREIA